MKKILFLAIAFAGTVFAADEELMPYETHLPRDMYLYCKNNHLLEEHPSHREGAVLNIDRREDEGQEYVQISYCPSRDDGWVEVLVAYQDHKLMGYVFFDKEGRDYVPAPPITSEDEEEIFSFLMNDVLTVFTNR